ncbi:MAG: glycosyltransferase N-terminal domain-containing protein [Paracoccaceae bacterium]
MQEKLGYFRLQRPEGLLLWFHALSVGESLALLTLLKRLGRLYPSAHFLLTTNTKTSVEALTSVGLPERVIHSYLPADARGPVQRFLNHWKPDILAITETDLWPYMITQASRRGIPLVLINGRVANTSFRRRMKTRNIYYNILPMFQQILAQDKVDADRFIALRAPTENVQILGSLKSSADPLPYFFDERDQITTKIGGRPVWLAASTEPREEDQMFEAHSQAREKIPDLLMIIAPRHIKFADKTESLAKERFNDVSRRSNHQSITSDTAVYIADSFGEMGLWYTIALLVFIGHTMPGFLPPLPGKNPYEALNFGAYVLHGPDYADFTSSYGRLTAAGATKQILNASELASEIINFGQSTDYALPFLAAAKTCMAGHRGTLEATQNYLSKMLEQGPNHKRDSRN